MEKDLPVYEMKVGSIDDDDVAVDFVALVDDPAIMRGWMKFSGDKPKFEFKVTNEERRYITGPLMIADLLIYRNDPDKGEFYVKFRRDTIEDIVKKFAKAGYHNNVNRMHDSSDRPSGIYMIESFIIDSSRGIKTPDVFDTAPEGSWFGTYYVENDDLWEEIKSGKYTGFSVEGFFQMAMRAVKTEEEQLREDLEAILKALKKF